MLHKNNKFKMSQATWDEELELPDRSYSVLDKHVNKIQNRITFKIQTFHIISYETTLKYKKTNNQKEKW